MLAAVESVQAQPDQVAADAHAVLETLSSAEKGTELEAAAAWAAGLAARERNRLEQAEKLLVQAVSAARESGAVSMAGRIRVSLALVVAYLGDMQRAMAELDAAERSLAGADLAHALLQRGLLQQRAGQLDQAFQQYERALPLFAAAEDRVGEVRLRVNRSVGEIYLAQFAKAQSDLDRARELATALGQGLQMAVCALNLGILHGRRGDLPRALHWLDVARADSQNIGAEFALEAVIQGDRAELLASVGLVSEAFDEAILARDTIARTENRVELAESNLLVARVALAAHDYERASLSAGEAAQGFRQQGRLPWARLAEAVGLRSRSEVASLPQALRREHTDSELKPVAEEASAMADALVQVGWSSDALAVRFLAGRLWLSAGDMHRAVQELARVSDHRHRGLAGHRVLAWQAEAMARFAGNNWQGTRRAIRAGLRVIDQHRMTLAAADLRATVSVSADELASWLVELALESRKAREVLSAAESWRAGSLVAPVSPPPDAELERLLGRLRSLDADERQEGSVATEDQRAALEAAVRDRARHLPAVGRQRSSESFSVAVLVEQVGDRLLVEFVESRGQLYVIWITGGVVRMRPVGAAEDAESEARSARGCLQRLATGAGSARSLAAAADTLATATGRLANQLLDPVKLVSGRPIIVVPTGALHGVPWSALDPLAEAPFVIAPSARSWLAADKRLSGRESGAGKVLLAAGPGLDGAREEVTEISRLYRDVLTLTGEDATVEAALEGLESANVAHLAAHGSFRTDNPLLSVLRLADGNLTVYEMERVPRISPTVILSACDAAAVRVYAGDELLGFSSTMLGLGATTVVAPMLPVADDVTTDLLVELHRSLIAGAPVPDALRRARVSLLDAAESGTDVYRRRAAAGSFVAIGA